MSASLSLSRLDPRFPPSLLAEPWPEFLDLLGHLDERPMVAIVGARAASARARERAREVAKGLAEAGIGVVSGGALGVDAAAHRGALLGGGYTLAVMACGVDTLYPERHERLFDAMLERGGGIVSPFGVGALPLRGRFVKRNRIIAALAQLVVVVEASPRSGSLHTARHALSLGRPLAVFPGSAGTEALLACGAICVESPDEVLAALRGEARARAIELPAVGTAEHEVLMWLHSLSSSRGGSVRDLCESLLLPVRRAQRLLLALEMRSLVLTRPGQCYLLSPLARAAIAGQSAALPCGPKQT